MVLLIIKVDLIIFTMRRCVLHPFSIHSISYAEKHNISLDSAFKTRDCKHKIVYATLIHRTAA